MESWVPDKNGVMISLSVRELPDDKETIIEYIPAISNLYSRCLHFSQLISVIKNLN